MPRKSQLLERDVGEFGEDHFKGWCTLNRLSAVKSVPDRMGWDYFVEFEPELDDAIPLDRQNSLKKVLVQVKSTDTPSRSVRGKLSAFKRLVDSDLPAFIAHIDFSGQPSPRRARFLHIGPTQIEAILRKVRQTEEEGRSDLHNVTMTLSLNEAAEIDGGGGNLRNLILDAVPRSSAEYVAAKAAVRKTSGYDERSIKADFSLALGLDEEALVDLLIGRVPHLPFREMVVNRTRFGITLDKDIDYHGEGTLSVEVKPLQQGKLVAFSPSRSRRVEMTVGVFVPAVQELPKRLRKLRLANEFIDLILNFGEGRSHVKFGIDSERCFPLDELTNALAFGITLADGGARLEVDLGLPRVASVPVPQEAEQLRHWSVLHEFMDILSVALFRHRRGAAAVEVTMREMGQALDANTNMFTLLARPGLEMTFAPSEGFPVSAPTSAAIFVPTCIEFGSLAYFAIVRAEAKEISIEEDGLIRFVGDQPRMIEDGVIERSKFQVTVLNHRAAELGQRESGKDRYVITTTLADPSSVSSKEQPPARATRLT